MVQGDKGDLPSAPDMKQRSGIPGRLRSPAGGCREARLDCGFEHGSRPPETSHLLDETEQEDEAIQREREKERILNFCLL